MNNKGALIKNERFKLYKKPATWIMALIVVGIALLIFLAPFIMKLINNDYYENDNLDEVLNIFIEDSESRMSSSEKEIEEAANLYGKALVTKDYYDAKANYDFYTYMKEHDLDALDWQVDLLFYYNRLKNFSHVKNISVGETGGYTEIYVGSPENHELYSVMIGDGALDVDSLTKEDFDKYFTLSKAEKEEVDHLEKLLSSDDWKTYAKMQIEYLKTSSNGMIDANQKAIEIEMLETYLEFDVPPTSNYLNIGTFDDSWKSVAVESIARDKDAISNRDFAKVSDLTRDNLSGNSMFYREGRAPFPKESRLRVDNEIEKNLERLRTNVAPPENESLSYALNSSITIVSYLITFFAIFIAGSMFSSEFSSGTIKLLVIAPFKRQKIFWAKVRALAEIILALTIAILILGTFGIGLFNGFKGIGSSDILSVFGNQLKVPSMVKTLLLYGIQLIIPLVYGSLAFMLSTVTKRTSLSNVLPILVLIVGPLVASMFSSANTNLAGASPNVFKYSFFVLTDFSTHMALGISTLFAAVVIIITTICFIFIARDSFCRRDIT